MQMGRTSSSRSSGRVRTCHEPGRLSMTPVTTYAPLARAAQQERDHLADARPRHAADHGAVRSAVAARLGASGPTPRASVSPVPALLRPGARPPGWGSRCLSSLIFLSLPCSVVCSFMCPGRRQARTVCVVTLTTGVQMQGRVGRAVRAAAGRCAVTVHRSQPVLPSAASTPSLVRRRRQERLRQGPDSGHGRSCPEGSRRSRWTAHAVRRRRTRRAGERTCCPRELNSPPARSRHRNR